MRVRSETLNVINVEFAPDAGVVVLDRIVPGEPDPDYCTHGRTVCIACPEWVWLGEATFTLVSSGQARPLCLDCAIRLFPQGPPPRRHVRDHRRADGPHP